MMCIATKHFYVVMYVTSVSTFIATNMHTVIYWLIAAAITTFNKRKGAATKRVWVL